MDGKVFCKKGQAFVVANPYNRFEKNPERCLYRNDRFPTACQRCVTVVAAQVVKQRNS